MRPRFGLATLHNYVDPNPGPAPVFPTLSNATPTPTLDGQSVLGQPAAFVSAQFNGTTADEDAFLGLPAGTTRYSPAINGTAWACSGVLTGGTEAAVQAAQATLQGFAGMVVPFGRPTGRRWPDSWEVQQNCFFEPGELVFAVGGIVEIAAGYWSLGYRLVLRESGGVVTPT